MRAEIRAAIYCRISKADDDDFTKVEDQERICRGIAQERGWQLADGVGYPEPNGVFTDNSLSAWKRGVKRPGWEALFSAVDTGKINAIVAYHGDRLSRQPMDLEKLIEVTEGKGLRLASQLGDFDLDRSQDRAFARVIAAFAEAESARQSERRKTQYARMRREGLVRPGGTGGRAFGFATDGVTHVPEETELIREAAVMVLAGESASGVARWLNDKGMVTPAGNPFTHGTVRKMLARSRYAGLMPDGVSNAAWQPVLGREEWETLRAVLNARSTGYTSTNARKYLLSGIAKCGVCGKPIRKKVSVKKPGKPYVVAYACQERGCGKVFRSVELLDAYVTGAVLRRLEHEANPQPRVPELPGLAAEFKALTEARAKAAAAIEDDLGADLDLLQKRLKRINERLEHLREMAGESAGHRLIRQYAGISRDQFDALPLSVRRSLVAACFEVTVLPSSRRGPGFRTEDVKLTRR